MKPKCIRSTRIVLGQRFASVCAFCPDKKEGDLWAEANNFVASHGICSQCLPVQFPEAPASLLESARKNEGDFIP